MSDDPTLPPHQPTTIRTVAPRVWRAMTAAVAAHPDVALAVFLILFGAALVWKAF